MASFDVKTLIESHFYTLESVANCIGLHIDGDKLVLKQEVTLEQFKEALGEYMAECIEAGENPGYSLERLLRESEDQDLLKEMLFDE